MSFKTIDQVDLISVGGGAGPFPGITPAGRLLNLVIAGGHAARGPFPGITPAGRFLNEMITRVGVGVNTEVGPLIGNKTIVNNHYHFHNTPD